MTDIVIAQAGTWPTYRLTLTRSGYPLPLAGAVVVLHATHSRYAGWTITQRCGVVRDGELLAEFDPAETTHPGDYNATLSLNLGGETTALPAAGSFTLSIGPAYDPDPVERPPLKIYALEGGVLSLRAVIDAYAHVEWTRRWRAPGEFRAVVSRHATGAEEIAADRVVVLSRGGVHRAAQIQTIEGQLTETGEISEDWEISGREVGAVLAARLCLAGVSVETGYDDQTGVPAETAMRHYVEANAIAPSDPTRTVEGLALEAVDRARGGAVSVRGRFQPVAEILEEIALQSGLGWRVDYEFDTATWRFRVLAGVDRSGSILLSPRIGNATISSYLHSTANAPTTAIVAGQGEAAARAITAVGAGSGWARRETFIDARDLDDAAKLAARGAARLAETGEETALEIQYVPTPTYRYGADFDLGDIVRGEYPGVCTIVTRIVAVTEEYPSGAVRLALGAEWPDLISILRSQKKDSVEKRR